MKQDPFLEKISSAKSSDELNWLITKNLLENLTPDLTKAVWAASIPHWFNSEILSIFLQVSPDLAEKIYIQLQQLPFVETFIGKGHSIHDVTRRLLTKTLWEDQRDEFISLSTRAAEYFSNQNDSIDVDIEYIYHLYIVDSNKANLEFIAHISKWSLTGYREIFSNSLSKRLKEHIDSGRLPSEKNIIQNESSEVKINNKSLIPVSKSKIIPPSRRPQLLTRKRLLEFMYEALDKKLTLISAPAGYGKTSLLVDLIHNEGNDWKNCWLALDELDKEPQRFATYFIASITQQFPEFGKHSSDALENMKSFDQDMERFLVTLINDLIENTDEFFVIILDDFQLVEEIESIKKFINRFIQLMPEHCRLVISSRKLADLPELTRLIAHGDASGIDFSDLAFQPEELQALIAQNEGKYISKREAKRLANETEGWITGLQFSHIKSPASGDQSNLFNYFKQQILDKQAPEIREFILRTSLFDEFDANLCEAVLQPLYSQKQDWQTLIKNIADNNSFALPVGEGGNGLRYHQLFSDFLRLQFKNERPSETKKILSNLQIFYETLGEWPKAFNICRQLNDLTAQAEMVERAGSFMLKQPANNIILDSWLSKLPVSMLNERPRLLSIRGALAYLKGDLQESLNLLNQAVKTLQAEEDTTELALALFRRSNTYGFLGSYEEALSDIDKFIQLAEDNQELRSLYAEALRGKGIILTRLGQARQAIHLLEKSLNLYEILGEEENSTLLLMETGLAYRTLGDFEQAKQAYMKALQIWEKAGNTYQQANLLNNLGIFYQFLGQYEEAVLALEKGLIAARSNKNLRIEALISIGLGDVYAEIEDFEMAKQNYQYANEIIKTIKDQFLQNTLIFSQANTAILQKDSAWAQRLIDSIKDGILSNGSNYEISFLSLLLGRISLLEKNFNKAVNELRHAESYFAEGGRSIETDIVRVWLAGALHQNKKSREALDLINSLTIARGKLLQPVVIVVYQAREWLNGLPNNKILHDLVSDIDKITEEFPSIRNKLKRQASVGQYYAPKLKIQAFGNAIVYIDDKPANWQSQVSNELFFYFLKTGKSLMKEQIGELLWPSISDPSKLSLRFKNEIYRLRKVVGQNTILYENDLYRFNQNLDYEYDVETFEKFINHAKKSQETKQKIDFYQKAIDLVQGPYLNDIYSDWVLEERARLEQIYLKTLHELADLYLKDGQLENAINICEKAIQIDPSEEKPYEIAMKTYYKLGQRASIIRIYQRYKAAIKEIFNHEVSEEMIGLYQELTK